jgi:hypothetical protein
MPTNHTQIGAARRLAVSRSPADADVDHVVLERYRAPSVGGVSRWEGSGS